MVRWVAAGALVLGVTACNQAPADEVRPERESDSVGRYTIVFSPHMRNDTMLLDTVTGTTWQMVETPGSQGGIAWEKMAKD